eukprot:CAMPEP_0184695466 /NCGR_PEP_ID=MMETSP0313-20130426/3081_1 /TAXON_ID=2792 /ORGANISM="Porphyridium aerugineum, Strain SAG 1380-2" /LENGTH=300 /DNA_ID=CAMNT_0027153919 /DNA_START=91 /DNA_END=993 /DNA_ORIENTATION=-
MHSRNAFPAPGLLLVLALFLFLTLCIRATPVAAQATCPCSKNLGNRCGVVKPHSGASGLCKIETVPCDCYCDYSGKNNNGVCPLDLIAAYEVNANMTTPKNASDSAPFTCEPGEILMPRCGDQIDVPIVSNTFDCSQDLVLYGRGYVTCKVPPIDCQPIISASLDYWQWSKYTANISYGEGIGFYNVFVEITNFAEYPEWFANGTNLPGVVINRKGVIEGPAWKDEPSFLENKTFTSYGTKEFAGVLSENCKDKANKDTVFTVAVDFQTANTGSDFNDQKPYGLHTVTHLAVGVQVTKVE